MVSMFRIPIKSKETIKAVEETHCLRDCLICLTMERSLATSSFTEGSIGPLQNITGQNNQNDLNWCTHLPGDDLETVHDDTQISPVIDVNGVLVL